MNTSNKQAEQKWIFTRKGEVRQVFNNRREAIKYFKELLKKTLKDFETQDKSYEYDYEIEIPEMKFEKLNERSTDLSLL